MKNKIKLKIHSVYWLTSGITEFIAYTLPYYEPSGKANALYWTTSVLNIVVNMAEFYTYYFILIPAFLIVKRSYPKFLISMLLVMIIGMTCRYFMWNTYNFLYLNTSFEKGFTEKFSSMLSVATFYALFSIMVKFIEVWIETELKKKELLNANASSKIDFLKSQISPHYLFNTLNNVYSLSMVSKNKTADALEKLNKTFEYLTKIEKCSTVKLSEELDYIESFIELSKIRVANTDKIIVNLDKTSLHKEIYPLLLIPFVENAFKHSNLNDEGNYIKISSTSLPNGITFEVENSIPSQMKSKDSKKGIGLKNLKERLSLLYNKNQYEISTQIKNNSFYAKLKIDYVH